MIRALLDSLQAQRLAAAPIRSLAMGRVASQAPRLDRPLAPEQAGQERVEQAQRETP